MQLNKEIAAVVTGGSSGLGAATARKLAGHGVKVTLFDVNEEAGKALAQEIGGQFVKVDVTSDDSVKAGLDAAEAAHGPTRILVNCAGIAPVAKTTSRGEPHPMDMFQTVINVNLVGTFRCTSFAGTRMANLEPLTEDGERGVIISTASVAAFDGQIGQAAYAASKGGIAALTLPVARDLSKSGIRVMTVAPGIFETPMLRGLSQEVQDSLGQQVPFPSRLGRGDEYAQLVEAICTNPMLNGETIRLDGAIRMAPR
ncbi:3-oxoacyl-[acyl-carrier-protein] reductase FabG [Pseudovibrio sp. W64]|uniref:SDR family NAD(P)-dependent oxidoreductase n=1 Tax=unclassified Pseudovibrio TaxID=2627060 RepID=UPI000709D410|nr:MULTISPECIES: SDR family NAD(P)-dependent oxidoreductase [unclassified Pseudovibrio]KZK81717.1 3-oxoacyl-[acyl-carrier-protein] reductase FabG [Pseudovibrio sp. W64]KZK92095.1 3-oxoacyl-[acyl-carrier-protein] reductase FabG [Pseudovibrio sp. Ad5]KZK94978.1 3-oxoacyl-[acyl-carrier-protein] reductase FabG [Pseudovibrio sp. W74]KZL06059.1 3-oxoacyl-[acyl-carrier-protein] reductase FabG [Pseudovibrio sp. Ad26]KZL08781.1 3-oxoacyl-[acyl-carrier-protein] reductase FabG [Pseudovibrio sp. Ad14]